MAPKFQADRYVIDVFTGEYLDISKDLMRKCKNIGIDYTCITKMESGKMVSIKNRYTTPNHIDKIFKLKDVDTGEVFNCITNTSLFIQTGIPYSDNGGKYIYELKAGRQKYANISGRIFALESYDLSHSSSRKFSAISYRMSDELKVRKTRYRIKLRITKRIWDAMRSAGVKKDNSSIQYLGCSIPDYMNFLKRKFRPGMTFENYGDWHIDHITPCSEYDVTIPSEAYKAFHYTNTQPMWATSKIAESYGDIGYVGNLNKNKKLSLSYDIKLVGIVDKLGIMDHNDAIRIATMCHNRNIRMVVTQDE